MIDPKRLKEILHFFAKRLTIAAKCPPYHSATTHSAPPADCCNRHRRPPQQPLLGNRPNIYSLFSRFGNQPFSTRLR